MKASRLLIRIFFIITLNISLLYSYAPLKTAQSVAAYTKATIGGYLFPWEQPTVSNSQMFITQNYFGDPSHGSIHAVDFVMKDVTNPASPFVLSFEVISPKYGVIIDFRDNLPEGSFDDESTTSTNECFSGDFDAKRHSFNYILLGHGKYENNKYEFYTLLMHFQPGSIPDYFYRGYVVKIGEFLGRSGNSGYSSAAHIDMRVSIVVPTPSKTRTLRKCDSGERFIDTHYWIINSGQSVTYGFEENANDQWLLDGGKGSLSKYTSYNSRNIRQEVCEPATAKVILYNHINYGGECVTISDPSQPFNVPTWMHVSAIYLNPQWDDDHQLTLFDAPNNTGNNQAVHSSIPDFTDPTYNLTYWQDNVRSTHNAYIGNTSSWLSVASFYQRTIAEIDIHIHVFDLGDFDAFRICFDGENCQETAATELYYTWKTYNWANGLHKITIQYRRDSDNQNWQNADIYDTALNLSPDREGLANCGSGSGAELRSGMDCILLMVSKRDLASIGWADRSDLVIKAIGPNEVTAYDDADYQGTVRTISPGQEMSVGGNVSSILVSPTCPIINGWKGEYWNNDSLSGTRSLCRDDSDIDFDWQEGSPDPSIQVDHFSARWTKNVYIEGGIFYTFHVYHDDGFRLYYDGNLFMENWCTDCRAWDSKYWLMPTGVHELKLEVFDNTGWSSAKIYWEPFYPPTWNFLKTLALPWQCRDNEPRIISADWNDHWVANPNAGAAIDFDLPGDLDYDKEILAPVGGTIQIRESSNYGVYATIDAGNGWSVLISNLQPDNIKVHNSDTVSIGQWIGSLGNSKENAPDSRIHLEVKWHDGKPDSTWFNTDNNLLFSYRTQDFQTSGTQFFSNNCGMWTTTSLNSDKNALGKDSVYFYGRGRFRVPDWFHKQASALDLTEGNSSVTVYEQVNQQGGAKSYYQDKTDLSGEVYNNGVAINDNVTSLWVGGNVCRIASPPDTTTSIAPACPPGDIEGDGDVDVIDLGILFDNFDRHNGLTDNPSGTSAIDADIDQDGNVDVIDMGIMFDNWGSALVHLDSVRASLEASMNAPYAPSNVTFAVNHSNNSRITVVELHWQKNSDNETGFHYIWNLDRHLPIEMDAPNIEPPSSVQGIQNNLEDNYFTSGVLAVLPCSSEKTIWNITASVFAYNNDGQSPGATGKGVVEVEACPPKTQYRLYLPNVRR